MRECHQFGQSWGLYRGHTITHSKAISACEDVISFVSPGGLIIAKMSSVWLNPVVSIILVESVRVRLANGDTRLLAVRQSVHARMSSFEIMVVSFRDTTTAVRQSVHARMSSVS